MSRKYAKPVPTETELAADFAKEAIKVKFTLEQANFLWECFNVMGYEEDEK